MHRTEDRTCPICEDITPHTVVVNEDGDEGATCDRAAAHPTYRTRINFDEGGMIATLKRYQANSLDTDLWDIWAD